MYKHRYTSFSILVIFFIVLVYTDSSFGIPAFARKYRTSCATCHMGFPKLTPFGEAFRINGFRMPEIEDESVKEDPISLGAEAYKRVWPEAIWPGSIPGTAPVSFRVRQVVRYVDEAGENSYFEFTQPTLQIMSGGSFTEKITFFAGAHLFEKGKAGSIDRMYIKFNDLFSNYIPLNALNMRIGQFAPDIVSYISNHRSLTLTSYAFNTYARGSGAGFEAEHEHGGSGSLGIENFQLGAEISGILKSRFRYVLGMTNGNGTSVENNTLKDFYGKIAFKVGGMAFDGTSEGDIFGGTAENWAEKSLTVSLFSYKGFGVSSKKNVDVSRLGMDFNLFMRDWNILGGFISGSDEMIMDSMLKEMNYSLAFIETNYMIYPWLICLVRYEMADPEGLSSFSRLIPHFTALYTANMKFNIETRIDPDDPELSNLQLGIDFAF